MESQLKGRILFSDNYQNTIESIRSITGNKSTKATVSKALTENTILNNQGEIGLVEGYESKRILDPYSIKDFFKSHGLLSSYDESILELNSLEGKVRCTAHCCTVQNDKEYVPAGYVTLKFFTRSEIITGQSNSFSDIIRTKDIAKETNDHYIRERKFFLEKAAAKNSTMFIDGSLFSGAATSGNFVLINDLLHFNCKPIFFVKNSESTIITEKMNLARGYNSDLHWANSTLKSGEMSEVFYYTSPDGRAKAMCFIKIYKNRSPVRIELPLVAFIDGVYDDSVFNLIYYQFLASGSQSNVQPRIIQVAEMYAREILKSTNIYKEIERLGLTMSMNEERF